MDHRNISENMTQKNKPSQTEMVYRILKAIHTVLALLALILAVALTFMTVLFLDIRGQNNQFENVQATNDVLRAENGKLIHKVPETWAIHNESLYYFSCLEKSWEEAEKYCKSLQSHLTSVTSVEEQEFIRKKADGSSYWIGLTNQNSSDWRWIDGTLYDDAKSKKFFWVPNEPNNSGKNEHCVHISKNKLQSWNDNQCYLNLPFICKIDCKSLGLCPLI